MMTRLFLLMFLLASLLSSSNTFSNPRIDSPNPKRIKVECPKIDMDYPDPFDEKAPLRFQVRVKGIRANTRLKFSWFVSAGYIKSGQGTPSVIVEAKGAQRQGLTATVVICGLPYECENEISRTTAVAKSSMPYNVAPWLIAFRKMDERL
jgi:hypothetical protein